MVKKLAMVILLLFSLSVIYGCNTMHGFGKDIENLGDAVQKGTGKEGQ